ncbi:MAG: prepilin-type N-terminal cleavage/methylation domain-containing protein [Smithellaceae bacterium]|jgi:prepilin-type N-terminal cleavage/methylation domain-containing protein
MKGLKKQAGFTLIELLIVMAIVVMMLSVSLSFSANLYHSYKASMKAEEVLVFISKLRRESFLYSEAKVLSSANDALTIDGEANTFEDTLIRVDTPILFYRNGTTSGGAVRIYVGDQLYTLDVHAPLGGMLLTRVGSI